MLGRLVKVTLKVTLVFTALWAVGQFVTRRLSEGDAESDEFTIATFFGGVDRRSVSASLRSGRVLACFGGVNLDLRQATLDPGGAELVAHAYLGGVNVLVRPEWRVTVEKEAKGGGVDARLTPHEELPEDAPSLLIRAVATMGGVAVMAKV